MQYSIPVNSMFFVLGQGGIDSLLSKRNKIEQIIEILSGSYKYKDKYDNLVKCLTEKKKYLENLSTFSCFNINPNNPKDKGIANLMLQLCIFSIPKSPPNGCI